ncbi:MAG: alanine racemase [Candidatus Omnitrophica bacterium]|nr:alanine racemase [Candidatus Omnitrophota bacterium]
MVKRAWLEISLSQIAENLRKIRQYTGGKRVMACVKADCYGLGMKAIAPCLEKEADCFGVATVAEALELKKTGITKPILVLGPVLKEELEPAVNAGIRLTLFSLPLLRSLSRVALRLQKTALVHLKIDTGMGRIGLRPSQLSSFFPQLFETSGVKAEGIFTHLATAEAADKTYAREQLRQFELVLTHPLASLFPLKHVANSGALLNLPESWKSFDLVRIGLLLYGVYPDKRLKDKLKLQCALRGFTRVAFIKEVPPGSSLSYGASYTTKKKTRIATLSIGYADGLRRNLSNRFAVVIKGRQAPIIGTICMDQTLVDISGIKAKEGDKVCFLQPGKVEEMAEILQTAAQEILCGLASHRLEKIYL